MVTAEGAMDLICEKYGEQMVLERGHYTCPACGYVPDERDSDEEEPRTMDDLSW